MGRWKHTSGEIQVTAEGSVLDQKLAATDGWEPLDDAAQAADEATPSKPSKSATKAEWVVYAKSHGMDEATAEAMTRADLAALYADA